MSFMVNPYRVGPVLTVFLVLSLGDSRPASNVYAADPPPANATELQWVRASFDDEDYDTLTAGVCPVTVPYANPVNNQGNDHCGEVHYAISRLRQDFGNANTRFVTIPCGSNGASVVKAGHTLGPLPDSITTIAVEEAEAAIAGIQAQWPGCLIKPVVYYCAGTNDAVGGQEGTIGPALRTALGNLFPDLWGVPGWASAPIVVGSIHPEYISIMGSPLYDRGMRTAALETDNVLFCQLPTGCGSQHAGDFPDSGNPEIGIEITGDAIAASISYALGLADAPAFEPDFVDNYPVEEGTAARVSMDANKRVLYSVRSGYESIVNVSDPMDEDIQTYGPVGDEWPAFVGGPGDTIELKFDWRDQDGLTQDSIDPLTGNPYGPVTTHVVITEAASGPANPAAIFGAGNVAWYEAADAADGGVASLDPAGGTMGGPLVQATSGKRPVRAATSFNGVAGITHDGSDDDLVATLSGIAAGTPISVFIAMSIPTGAPSNGRVITVNSPPDADFAHWLPMYFPGLLAVWMDGYGGLGQMGITPDVPMKAASILYAGSPYTHHMAIDEVESFPAATGVTYPAGFAPTELRIGSGHGGSNFMAMTWGTVVIVKGTFSTGQRDALYDWMDYQNSLPT